MNDLFSRCLYTLAVFAAVSVPCAVRAEVVCSSDVSYTWVKSDSDDDSDNGDDAAQAAPGGKPGQRAPTAPPTVSQADSEGQPTPMLIRFGGVQRAGFDEAGAKASLQIEVNRQKARASEQCKRDHESIGECLATKLSSRASTLNSLGFSARAELERALTKECSAQQGVCLSVDSSEPQCRTISAPQGSQGASSDKKSPGKKPESKKK